MYRLYLVGLIVLVLFSSIGLVGAQEPAPGSREDNDCYAGGALAGKCEVEWQWICGWYLARWTTLGGWSTPSNFFPDWCDPATLLPARPLAEADSSASILVASAGCVSVGIIYIDFKGGFSAPGTDTSFTDPTCTTPGFVIGPDVVYAPTGYDPDVACDAAFPGTTSSPSFADIYICL